MKTNRLGRSGLQVRELALGSWLTFGVTVDLAGVRALVRLALDHGVNFFDNAEAYADGAAERILGEAIRDLRREDLVICTKIFWGGSGPNDLGLSRKHLMEGTAASLRRLATDHVDVLLCHRPDPNVPMEEIVTTMDMIVRRGWAFYWGTSEWPAAAIAEARRAARENGCIPPTVEQSQYHLLSRARVEVELKALCGEGLGLTTFSPLACGVLTGKYERGIPAGSRLARTEWLREAANGEALARARALGELARELGATPAQFAIAWCLTNPAVAAVILGASSEAQLRENLGSLAVRDRIDDSVRARVDAITGPPS